MTTHEFGEVLAAAQGGAPWAVAVLWNELHPRLLRFLRGLDPSAAEDVEADTWLAAARTSEPSTVMTASSARGCSRSTQPSHRFAAHETRQRSVAVPTEILDEHPAVDDPADLALDAVHADAAVALVRSSLPEVRPR